MSRAQRVAQLFAVATVTTGLLLAGVLPASAHDHPTPLERAAPGVVYIEARAKVDVALIEHRGSGDPSGVHIGVFQSSWTPVLDRASGFTVAPDGTIVTTGAIAIAESDLDRAWIYGVNQAFHQAYGDAAPLPEDLFSRQRLTDENRLQERLTACYPPNNTNDAGGCIVRVTPDYVVYPYVTSQQEHGALRAEVLPGGTPDVAVLSVRGATSMPTVGLGESTAGAQALAALGFTGIPGPDLLLTAIKAHLQTVGGTVMKTEGLTPDEAASNAALAKAVHEGLAGGPLVAERGQVVGLFTPPTDSDGSAPAHLVPAADIRAALEKSGATVQGGPVDASFEAAMHQFKNKGYAASIPNFTAALQLFPGHLLATQNLAEAKSQAGTAVPDAAVGSAAAASDGGAGTVLMWIGIVVLVLLLAAAGWWLLRRRRRPAAPPPKPATAGPARAQASRAGQSVSQVRGSRAAASPSRPGTSPPSPSPRSTPPPARSGPAPAPAEKTSPRPDGARAAQDSQRPAPAGAPRAATGARRVAATSAPGSPTDAPVPAPRPVSSSSAPSAAAASPASQARSSPSRVRFCTSCGAKVEDGHRYCSSCGAPVS
jgi:cytoskeletal protein RodZ